jgi:hypothetical protein
MSIEYSYKYRPRIKRKSVSLLLSAKTDSYWHRNSTASITASIATNVAAGAR